MAYVTAVLTAILTLIGLTDSPTPAITPTRVLVIKAQPWSARSSSQPPSSSRRLVVVAGQKVEVRGLGEPVTVEVVDVTADGIRIRLSESMGVRSATTGTSFTHLRREFVVRSGEVTRFGTPSLDGGVDYDVRFASGR